MCRLYSIPLQYQITTKRTETMTTTTATAQTMIYPSNTAAPSVQTLFVNGIKFDVCEVIKEAYDMISGTKARFFLVVEDIHIVGIKSSEAFFKATGQTRWEFFCKGKAEVVAMVTEFEAKGEQIAALTAKADTHKGEYKRVLIERANNLRKTCMEIYGTYPF